jgi:hypothetical protein
VADHTETHKLLTADFLDEILCRISEDYLKIISVGTVQNHGTSNKFQKSVNECAL